MADPLSVESFPLFKGCTRPPILLGVPMVPLLITAIALLLLGLWFWMPIALLIFPAYFVMKVISASDEYRFRQWGLWLQLLFPLVLTGQRRWWAGCFSWSPATARRDDRHAQWILSPPAFLVRPAESVHEAPDEADYVKRVLNDAAGRSAAAGGLVAAGRAAGDEWSSAEEEEARFALPAVPPGEA